MVGNVEANHYVTRRVPLGRYLMIGDDEVGNGMSSLDHLITGLDVAADNSVKFLGMCLVQFPWSRRVVQQSVECRFKLYLQLFHSSCFYSSCFSLFQFGKTKVQLILKQKNFW